MRRILVGLALLLTACGNGGSDDPAAAPTADATPSVQECEDRTLPTLEQEDEIEDTKPEVTIPDGAPPCELQVQDIHEGSGAEAKADSTVTVHYVGYSWSTREQFEASWDGGEPATFPISGVIAGWQEGIPGMKVGGRRQLTIPPDMAYGPQGSGSIAPNETLIFVVDLLDVQ